MNRALRLLLVALLCAAAGWTVARMAHEGAWVRGWAGMSVVSRLAGLSWSALAILPFAACRRRSSRAHSWRWR